ncbi:hypothetical protein T484DRAFT_1905797, partial [Baffinella frigidus]
MAAAIAREVENLAVMNRSAEVENLAARNRSAVDEIRHTLAASREAMQPESEEDGARRARREIEEAGWRYVQLREKELAFERQLLAAFEQQKRMVLLDVVMGMVNHNQQLLRGSPTQMRLALVMGAVISRLSVDGDGRADITAATSSSAIPLAQSSFLASASSSIHRPPPTATHPSFFLPRNGPEAGRANLEAGPLGGNGSNGAMGKDLPPHPRVVHPGSVNSSRLPSGGDKSLNKRGAGGQSPLVLTAAPPRDAASSRGA